VSEEKQRTESSTARAKVWTSVVSTALGVVASLLSAVVSSAELFRAPWAIGAAIGAVLISAAFTALLTRRERGPSCVANLKNELHTAYLGALDRSALNPQAAERA
jgi:hypothetical protein